MAYTLKDIGGDDDDLRYRV